MTTPSSPGAMLRGAVPTTYVHLLFEYLEGLGADPAVLLGEAAPRADDAHSLRYPVARWKALLERAAATLGDPLLGLHLGRHISPAHFGLMGYALLACDDLATALERLRDFERLFYDVSALSVQSDDGALVLQWGTENGRPGPLVDEAALSALVQLLRDLLDDPGVAPAYVEFVNPPPEDSAPYAAYFGCRVRFAMPATRVALPLSLLQRRLRHPDPQLLALLQAQAQLQLERLPARGDFIHRVRAAAAAQLPGAAPSAEAVAEALHCSVRSLHRRLAAHGTNFRELREELLYGVARDYLADHRLQLAEVAQMLGYSEQSAFTRAFRRWSGRSPRAFRRQLTDSVAH